MYKILLIANANSKWVFRYVKQMLKENNKITIINDARFELRDEKREYYEYYESHNINVITVKFKDIYLRSLYTINIIDEKFDICHIMFASEYACITALGLENKFSDIVVNFFGTDFYKEAKKMRDAQEMLLQRADSIIMPVEKMEKEMAQRYPDLAAKINTVYFKSPVLELLKKKDCEVKSTGILEKAGIKKDRIIIAAGYKGGAYQQHELFIDSMNGCSEMVRQKAVVVFMMTYGSDSGYDERIKKKLASAKFDYVIIKEFLSDEEMAEFRRCTDIFVNCVKSDAFNAALQENLYSSSVVLCGDWLYYPQLNDSFILKFKDKNGLTESISRVITEPELYKKKSAVNKDIINKLDSQRKHIEDWSVFYKTTFYHQVSTDNIISYIFDRAETEAKRNELYKDIMEKWLMAYMKGRYPICEYIEKNSIKKAAIYGAGSLGEMTYTEIKKSDIQVDIFDSNIKSAGWYSGKIGLPDSICGAEYDCIIITPVHFEYQIKQELESRTNINKVVSLRQILH